MAVEWNQAALTAAIRKGAMAGVVSGVQTLQNAMTKKIMSPPKSGITYKRGGRTHQASAPGEAPANDLGNLVASIRQEFEPEHLRGFVAVTAPYAAALEYGALRTAVGGNWELEARPYARPSVVENTEIIKVEMQRHIQEAIALFNNGGRK